MTIRASFAGEQLMSPCSIAIVEHRGSNQRPEISNDVRGMFAREIAGGHTGAGHAVDDDPDQVLVGGSGLELVAPQIHAGDRGSIHPVAIGTIREEELRAGLDILARVESYMVLCQQYGAAHQ